MNILDVFANKMLLGSLMSWAIAQIVKTVIFAIMNKTIDLSRLTGDGGMPSAHSATVTSLATIAAFECGLSS